MGIGYFKKSMCIDADMVEHGMCMEPQYLGVTDCLEYTSDAHFSKFY